MFYTYILKSLKDNKFYIGSTSDLNSRIKRHNDKLEKSTKSRAPFILIYSEKFENKSDAYRRELEIKKMKGGIQFKNLIDNVRATA